MSIRLGLHFHGGDTDLAPVTGRSWRTFTVLDMDRGLIPHILARIPRQEWPNVLIHVRQMAELDPHQWGVEHYDPSAPIVKGRELARIAWELYSVWPMVTWVFTGLNEPEIESGVDTKEEFQHCARYCMDHAYAFHEEYRWLSSDNGSLGRQVLLGGRPSSPGHNEDGPDTNDWGYGYAILKEVWGLEYRDLPLIHIIVAHLYEPTPAGETAYWYGLRIFRPVGYKDSVEGVDAGDPGGLYWLARELNLPILISEANLTNVGDLDAIARIKAWLGHIVELDVDDRVVGIHWFVLDTPDPRFHTMKLILNENLLNVWATWVAPEKETTMPEFGEAMARLADRIRSAGYEVTALTGETQVGGGLVRQVVTIDGEPRVFEYQAGAGDAWVVVRAVIVPKG